jgi:hypothetical protein
MTPQWQEYVTFPSRIICSLLSASKTDMAHNSRLGITAIGTGEETEARHLPPLSPRFSRKIKLQELKEIYEILIKN